MSLLKKTALIFPSVRKVKKDLENRRIRADEFEAANKILVKMNEGLKSDIQFMKGQMSKALGLKDTAIMAESALAANAEHYHSQLSIMIAKYEKLKSEHHDMEAENCHLRLANDDLIRTNAEFKNKS